MVAGLTWLALARLPAQFKSAARIEVERDKRASQLDQSMGLSPYEHYAVANTLRERLLSTPVLTGAVERLGDAGEDPAWPRTPDERASALASDLSVTPIEDSWAIQLEMKAFDPYLAQESLKALIASYRDGEAERIRRRVNQELQLLEEQVADAQRSVDALRQREQAIRQEHRLLSDDVNDSQL